MSSPAVRLIAPRRISTRLVPASLPWSEATVLTVRIVGGTSRHWRIVDKDARWSYGDGVLEGGMYQLISAFPDIKVNRKSRWF